MPLTSSTPIVAPVLESLPASDDPDWSLADPDSVNGWSSCQDLENVIGMLKANLRKAHILTTSQNGIIEGSRATMVVQNLHLQKLNAALYGKETEKTSTRTLVIDSSKGQVYSGDAIQEEIHAQEERKKVKAAEKKSKAEGRAAKKEAQTKLENEWKVMKATHKKAMKLWKINCDKLSGEGVPKKHWPKAPARPKKPKLPASLEVVVDDDDGDDEEEDENTMD
ncbi:hypothetical protein CVT25_012553 [Psilocybe cyanescens]|uniref:Uncharacterized protein n=1 Tax=Psilocybe cyanescens TaxID=93625 RepID=A0A409XC20_PSICY|nr:hypothetical protein CVT25_012553 [Psilocybe cyanescens]